MTPLKSVHLYIAINTLTPLQAALAYAAKGIPVFPLQPGTKQPFPGFPWKRLATTDPETITSWWTYWPTANIAGAMGAVPRVMALDIDVKGGQDGVRSYRAISQDVFTGPIQQTPTGGQHLIMEYLPGLRNFTHKGELGGLDMRTDGGYIVLAPSVTPEGRYMWIQDGEPQKPNTRFKAAAEGWSTQSNTVTVEAPEIPEDLPDYHTLGLKPEYLAYLDRGDTGPWDHDESRAIFQVAGALQRRLQDRALVLGIMACNPYAWACACRHRQHGNVASWLWTHGIAKIVEDATRAPVTDVFSPIAGFQQQQPPPVQQPPPPEATAPPEPPPPTFFTRASTVTDLQSLVPRWVVRDVIEAGQVGLVYGDSQAFKSYLMLDLSLSVSMGTPWHGHQVSSPGPVWFLAGEGNTILWRRLEALRQARDLRHEDLAHLWLSCGGLNLMHPDHLLFLKQQLQVMGGIPPRLLIIDTMSTNAILDENNARDVAQLISILHAIAREWGTTIILVHHSAKANNKTARGSSALQNNTDFRIRLERVVPSRRILTQLFVEKLKGAEEPPRPLVFEGRKRILVGVHDMDDFTAVTDLVFERLTGGAEEEVQTARAQARLTMKQAEVYNEVKELFSAFWDRHGPNTGIGIEEVTLDLGNRMKLAPSAIRRYLNHLVNKGVLERGTVGDHELLFMKHMGPEE